MISRLLFAGVLGLAAPFAGAAHAGSAAPSCAHLAADGMRQNANLLLFLADAYLVGRSTVMEIPDEIASSATAEHFEVRDAKGNLENWIYIAPPKVTDVDVPPMPTSIPTLEFQFDQIGQLSNLQQRKIPCPISASDPSSEEILALLAQQQRLQASVLIGQNCNCITRESLETLANWADSDNLNLPRSTLNLFQPYVAFGPKIQLVSNTIIQVNPVPRSSQVLGYVSVEEMTEGLILGVNSVVSTDLVRAIPYYER